jgi:formylglycine-generating enzyme required for sulfatase activity/dienelactone hydrolase
LPQSILCLVIGQTVSHYRILERIGAGGMGVVYKAEDTKLRRTVALKFLPIDLTQDPDARERLRAEAQTASALDHPNICTIHEIDETPEGQVFVAMSFYDGETLKERIARGPLPVADAVRFATEAARAIAAAHEAGVVHRDFKPANIMITRRGELKLLDFGVAKLAGRTALTRTGTTFGTIAYMAPEHVTGQFVDQQTDVWAMGVVLYEMLTGKLPFDGEHEVAMINAIANKTPTPLRQLRADVPEAVERTVAHALQKRRDARYATAREMLADLEVLAAAATHSTAGAETTGTKPARPRRPIVWIAAAMVVIAVGAIGGWWLMKAARVRAARQSIPQILALIKEEKFSPAFRLMRAIEPVLAGDPEFERVHGLMSVPVSVRTNPAGADLYIKGYDEPDAEWIYLGRSPIDTRGSLGYFRWRIVKPGFAAQEGAREAGMADLQFTLSPDGSAPEGTVFVPDGSAAVAGAGAVPLGAFFIDKYEVTNRQFKAFVDAGGYTKVEYWREPFIVGGKPITRDEAMTRLKDATGRAGPAGWELSAYPKGMDDYPVTGVSWYEALAYAAWAGRELPTVFHWRRAAPGAIFSDILEFSNFSNKQAAPIGQYKGIGEFGTYDMAGNVREWCWNAIGNNRYILGGAWNEPNYMYQASDAVDPFDRAAINGFRTMKRAAGEAMADVLRRPVETVARDYSKVVPASDKEFEIYRRLYANDPTELKAVVESTDDSPEAWRVERVSFAAPYGGERIPAYLFLPRGVKPPYQTVVYFPHSGGTYLKSFEQSEMNYLGFVLQAGRALLFPMYKGTYERRLAQPPEGPVERRDLAIARIKDLQRAVDYVYTRSDLDHDRLAYFGVSLGARVGNISLAIEKRFKTAVLWSGGFSTSVTPNLPEIDDVNFAPRVTTPVLMLNGDQDFTFPPKTSQEPMFRLFGTPAPDKKYVVYPGGHVFPFARIIKDTLEWLDRYLGVPK